MTEIWEKVCFWGCVKDGSEKLYRIYTDEKGVATAGRVVLRSVPRPENAAEEFHSKSPSF